MQQGDFRIAGVFIEAFTYKVENKSGVFLIGFFFVLMGIVGGWVFVVCFRFLVLHKPSCSI